MQELGAGIIVVLAAAYLAARYLPATWRRRLAQRLSQGGKPSRLARWLDKSGAGCGSGCDSCSTDELRPPAHTEGRHKVIKLHRKR